MLLSLRQSFDSSGARTIELSDLHCDVGGY
jgi:hypothetical protein